MMRAAKYTLVELLVVVAIICVIMGAAMPAFVKMAKGNGVSFQGILAKGKFDACRDAAISQRAYVALILPGYESGIPDALRYHAYRPAIITIAGAPPYARTFSKWIDGEGWTKFQDNVLWSDTSLKPDAGYPVNEGSNASASNWIASGVGGVDFSDCGGGASTNIAAALVYRATGQLLTTPSVSITFTEGAYVWNSTGGVFTLTNPDNKLVVGVNAFTGKSKLVK